MCFVIVFMTTLFFDHKKSSNARAACVRWSDLQGLSVAQDVARTILPCIMHATCHGGHDLGLVRSHRYVKTWLDFRPCFLTPVCRPQVTCPRNLNMCCSFKTLRSTLVDLIWNTNLKSEKITTRGIQLRSADHLTCCLGRGQSGTLLVFVRTRPWSNSSTARMRRGPIGTSVYWTQSRGQIRIALALTMCPVSHASSDPDPRCVLQMALSSTGILFECIGRKEPTLKTLDGTGLSRDFRVEIEMCFYLIVCGTFLLFEDTTYLCADC